MPDQTARPGDGHGEAATDGGALLRPGDTCWQVARAGRFSMIVDAADYFAAAREAMLRAEHSIVLVGWDFDLRIDLAPGKDDGEAPIKLGAFLKDLVRRKPGLQIYILKWDMAVLYTLTDHLLPIFALDLVRFRRIHLRFDSTHPWTAAHHQKIAVIDDSLAFCGSIDMTTDRWDTRGHLPGDEHRVRPDGSPYPPWHDVTTAVDGEAAKALGELCRERWRIATGRRIKPPRDGHDLWPGSLAPQLRDVDVGISRTMPAFGGRPAVHEIEALTLAAIGRARRSIYIESQYFASLRICEALAARLAEPDGPEVIVVNPLSADGWLEQVTMGTARDILRADLDKADRDGRFGFYHPVNEAGEPIYVHAKVLVVDDDLLRVGSSNINNRSMGFDTECDLAVEARDDGERDIIASIRDDLVAEHLAVDVETLRRAESDAGGTLKGGIERLRTDEGRSLRSMPLREVDESAKALARSHLADPERPTDPERRISHLAKRMARRMPTAGWMALSTGAVLAGIVAGRRGRSGAGR